MPTFDEREVNQLDDRELSQKLDTRKISEGSPYVQLYLLQKEGVGEIWGEC